MNEWNPTFRPFFEATERYQVPYGGAGSGKSVSAAQKMIRHAAEDGGRVLTIRKVQKTCRNSTFQLYKDIIRAYGHWGRVSVNSTEMRIDFPSGGKIIHAGLDDSEKLKSISGVTRIWVEEATELDFPQSEQDEPDLAQIDLRLRGVDPEMDPAIVLTFNPTYEARRIFEYLGVPDTDLPTHEARRYGGDVFVQHTTHEDNPYVGKGYTSAFTRLGGAMAAAYDRGELVIVDDPDQVIPYEYVKRATTIPPEDGLQYMGVDVARFGDDDTVVSYWQGSALTGLEHLEEDDTQGTAAAVGTRIGRRSINAENVGVDAVGVGAGVLDGLRENGYPVTEIVSGGNAAPRKEKQEGRGDELRFKNLRSQMWWVLREALEESRISLAECCPQRLVEDLCAPRFRIKSGDTVEVEPKRGRTSNWGIQNRIGRSPDDGDAAVYGWALTELMLGGSKRTRGGANIPL